MKGLGVVLHNQPLGIASAMQIHFVAANFHMIDYATELFGQEMLVDDLIKEPIEYTGGMVKVPEKPGWGVELDNNSLNRYATDSTTVIDL